MLPTYSKRIAMRRSSRGRLSRPARTLDGAAGGARFGVHDGGLGRYRDRRFDIVTLAAVSTLTVSTTLFLKPGTATSIL
jgi:hypothetical protein